MGAAVIGKCGDWQWLKGILGLRGWQGEGDDKKVCWICQAGLTDRHHCYDFTSAASWRTTLVSQSQFWEQAQQEGAVVSPIWQFPGFHLSFVRPDWMHCVDLGTLQYLQGNILWELFLALGGRINRSKDACSKLEALLDVAARRLGLARPLHSLTVTMFRSKMASKPKLKIKAAEGRYLLPILRETMATAFDVSTEHQQTRLSCVDSLLECYKILNEWEDLDTPAVSLVRAGRRHLLLYRALRDNSPDPLRCHLYPKHHLVAHIIEGATVNPRDEWNYGDESEIGDACKLAKNTHSAHLTTELIARYRNTFTI